MSNTDKIIMSYIATIFASMFFVAFGTPYVWPARERQVICVIGNHPVSSQRAWSMDSSLTGKNRWICDKHLVVIYPRTVGDNGRSK